MVIRTPPPESEENKQIITYQRSARRKKQARLTCGGSCRNTYAPGICVMSKNPLSERSEFWIFAHAFSRFSEHLYFQLPQLQPGLLFRRTLV